MFLRRIATTALVLGVVCGSASAASADGGTPGPGDNWGWTDDAGVGAVAGAPGSGVVQPVAKAARPAAAPVCAYEALDATESAAADDMATMGLGPSPGSGPGGWFRKACTDANGYSSGVVVWLARPAAPNPSDLAQQALNYTALPLPGIGMSPPAGRDQLVNLTTFLWLDRATWRQASASASAGGVTVTTTARPERAVWSMGNGESVVCAGPDVPYDPSLPDDRQPNRCRYTYERGSAGQPDDAFVVTATVEWHVTWTAAGVPAGVPAAGDLGLVRRSASVPVRVAEAQAVNTSAR